MLLSLPRSTCKFRGIFGQMVLLLPVQWDDRIKGWILRHCTEPEFNPCVRGLGKFVPAVARLVCPNPLPRPAWILLDHVLQPLISGPVLLQ